MGIQSHQKNDQPSIQSHSSAQLLHLKKKHPGDTIPSPGNSNTLGIFFSLFENGLLTIPQDSNQKLHRAESRTIKMP